MIAAGAVHYRLLGPLAARRAGEHEPVPIDLGSPKQRAVLAMLLLSRGRVVSTDRLIDAVWAGDAPPSATASLQAYISNLRRALRGESGTSPIAWRSSGYAFDVPAGQLDVTVFASAVKSAREAAEAQRWSVALAAADDAIASWGGPLLQDLADEPWVRAEADGFAELLADARETRATALLAEGQVADAIIQAGQLHADQPLRDRACWLHMIALYRAGRAAEALDRFREHAARLDEELGLEPGAELRELQVSILRQEPSLAAWPRSPGWQGAAPVEAPAPEAVAEPLAAGPPEEPADDALVGRLRETTLLDGILSDAQAGTVGWLVMTGPAGIGKTRLAQELVDRARRLGGADAWARCPEEDGAPAWWPIRQLIRALGDDPATVLVPPDGVDADEARFAVYERVASLIEQAADAADGPLAIAIDDVQWADVTSARCLAYLVGALRQARVAFALTLREGEDDASVRPLLTALARAGGHRQLTVAPLVDAAVRELADRVATEPLAAAEAGALVQRTGGNPLFVREYARLAPSERAGGGIPMAVRSVLGRRLDGLDPGVLHVLRAAAVIGDVLDLELISSVTRLDLDEVADLLDDAADQHIVVPAAGANGYAFGHGLLRDEVLTQMPEMRRQRLHARVAEVLTATGAEPSRRAQHLMQALPLSDPADALEACRAAAQDAAERWSSETAAEWWQQALVAFDLLPPGDRTTRERDDLIGARVDALALAGRRKSVLEVIETGMFDAVREGRTSTVGRLAASLLRVAGAWPWVSSSDDPGRLRARLDDIEPLVASDPEAHVRVLAALAVGSIYASDRSIPDDQSRRAIEIATRLGDPDLLADALLARIIAFSGIATHREECLELIEQLNALPHERSRVDHAVCHGIASMATMNLGDVAATHEHVRQGIVESEMLRLPVLRVQLRWAQGQLAQWHGDFDAAAGHYGMANELHSQTELHSEAAGDIPTRSVIWDRGALGGETDPGLIEPIAWSAAIASARGEHDRAAALVHEWIAGVGPMVWTTLGHATLLAHVAAESQVLDAVPWFVAFLEPYADAIAIVGNVGGVGSVGFPLARLYGLLGRTDEARALLARTARAADASGGLPTLLRCRLLAVELGFFDGAVPRELAGIADEAERIGMLGVRDDALALLNA